MLALLVGSWVFYDGQRLMRADLVAMKARHDLGNWLYGRADPPSEAAWKAAHDALSAGLAITPDDSTLHEYLGDLYTVAGRRDAADPERRIAHFRKAITHYEAAIRLRPVDPMLYAVLAWAHYGSDQSDERFVSAWQQALKLGPNEGPVQQLLFELAVANWVVATPPMKQWTLAMYTKAKPAQRQAMDTVAKQAGLVLSELAAATPGSPTAPVAKASAGSPAPR